VPISTAPVLVTGATGFIASHIVANLLAGGHHVRGTVRSLKKPDIDRLRQLPGASERLELVEADLTRAGSFHGPAAGCASVLHTASPYTLDARDPQRDLVDPAVNGTIDVLTAAAQAGTVTRVVVTSSMAAITDEPDPNRTLTETDWNVRSSLDRNPYYYSKVLAERAAWSFVERTKPGFDLVAVNPFATIGPSLTAGLNTSNQILAGLLRGQFPGVLAMAWGFVDVRDTAEAHVRAMTFPAASGRYICAGEVVTMKNLVQLLRERGYGRDPYKLPRLRLDSPFATALVRLAMYTQSKGTRQYFHTHLGRVPRFDNTKIRRDLDLSFRPVSETILETVKDLEAWGHVPVPAARTQP
jgi:dihydroflavonol-4-reductase